MTLTIEEVARLMGKYNFDVEAPATPVGKWRVIDWRDMRGEVGNGNPRVYSGKTFLDALEEAMEAAE